MHKKPIDSIDIYTLSGRIGKVRVILHEVAVIYTMHVALRGYCL